MELPVRRSVIALCALGLAALVQPSSSFILAIDLGSQFFKAAIVKPGTPFEIVHNQHSKRKTPTAVSFHEVVRTFGDDALPNAGKNMKKTPMLFTAQLGRNLTAEGSSLPWLPEMFYPFNLEVGAWGGLQFRGSEEVAYSVEEATAHVLTFANQISEEAADGVKVSETILTVPSDATFNRRRAILAAAEIAGLPRPHLMHETSASALQRSLDLDLSVKKPASEDSASGANDTNADGTVNASDTDLDAPEIIPMQTSTPVEDPVVVEEVATAEGSKQRVLFYNMGARHVEACVVEYRDARHMGKPTVAMDMLGCGVNEDLGGHQVDMLIAKQMLELFQSKQPMLADGVIKSVRALRKLEKEANSIKHVLSANKEGQFRVESLFEDTDFMAAITREELEKWSAELFASITKPIEVALANSGTSIADLDAVEMIGGGWRIPRVQALLAEYLESKRPADSPLVLSQHVNGEEGMATGAAFYGANNSVSFRTKKIYFTDTTPHSYTLFMEPSNLSQAHEEGWSNTTELFAANSQLGSKTTVKVHHAFDIKASLLENDKVVHVWELQGVHKAATEKYSHLDPPLMTLKFEIDSSGVLQLNSATAIFDELIVEPPKPAAKSSAETSDEGEAKEGEAKEGEAKEGEAKEGEQKEGDAKEDEAKEDKAKEDEAKEGEPAEGEAKEGEAKDGEAKEGEAKEDEPVKAKKPKMRKLKVALDVTDRNDDLSHRVMSAEEKKEAQQRVHALEAADAEVHRTKAAQNALEAFIYEAREKMSEDESCVQVSTEEEREAVTSQAASLEDWLYEDEASQANASVFEEKHAALKELVHPVLRRAYELTQRPELEEIVDKVRRGFNSTMIYVEQNMTWVSEKEREGVANLSVAFEEWYANVTDQQKTKADTEEPAFYTGDAKRRLSKIQSEVIRLTKIKKIDYDYSKYGEHDKYRGYGGGGGGYGGYGGYDDPKMKAYYEEMFRNFNSTNGSNSSDFWRNRNFSNFSGNDSDYMRSFYEYAARNASGANGTKSDEGAGGEKPKGEEDPTHPEAGHEEL